MKTLPARVAGPAVFILIGVLITLSVARGSTVLQMSFGEVAHEAELIFEGVVLDHEVIQSGPRTIHTQVNFRILDVLKGDYADDTITLSYLGGRVGHIEMSVGEMKLPALGESGVYFVSSLTANPIHPLVGWAQGHYLVKADAGGTPRIHTADDQPVTAIDPQPGAAAASNISEGLAAGVRVQALVAPTAPLSVAEFKTAVQNTLQAP